MATKTIEDGIRAYLDSLGTGSRSVVNREAVKALKTQLRGETDALNKAKLYSELEREEAGQVPDFSGEQAVFIAQAKTWAVDEGVTVGAFEALGVPIDVLEKAGFEPPTSSQAKATTRTRRPSTGTRASSIPLEEVLSQAKKLGKSWKLADLAAALDREPMTVRNYVTKLVESGAIVDLGDDPEHDGRGRAPKVYTLV